MAIQQGMSRPWARAAVALALACGAASASAQAGSSVMIWPVDPVIEEDQRAAALWLENRSGHSISLQLRVFGWSQSGSEENYEAQERVVASPPLAVIPAGQRQLVRLMNTATPAEGREHAFRVLVDELPASDSDAASGASTSIGVRLQIRYSIPLFIYGKGLPSRQRLARSRDPAAGPQPRLSWQVVREGPNQYLAVRNRGNIHARLTNVQWSREGRAVVLNPGLLGYVLAQSEMRWPLQEAPPAAHALQARVNGAEALVELASQ